MMAFREEPLWRRFLWHAQAEACQLEQPVGAASPLTPQAAWAPGTAQVQVQLRCNKMFKHASGRESLSLSVKQETQQGHAASRWNELQCVNPGSCRAALLKQSINEAADGLPGTVRCMDKLATANLGLPQICQWRAGGWYKQRSCPC